MKLKYIVTAGLAMICMPLIFAGYLQPAVVDVDLDNNFVGGDMVSARYADNETEFIGCGVRNFDDGLGGIFETGFCQAEDAEGDRAACFTSSPHLLDAIKAISDFSYITYSYNVNVDVDGNESFECTRIGNSTQSFYLPEFTFENTNSDGDDDDDDSDSDDDD